MRGLKFHIRKKNKLESNYCTQELQIITFLEFRDMIMKIKIFLARIMKIIKFLEFHLRIMKI